jgi:hypothetical protein
MATMTHTTKKQPDKNNPRRKRATLFLRLRAQPNPPNKLQLMQINKTAPGLGSFEDKTTRMTTIGKRPTISHIRVTAALLPFGFGSLSI